VNCVNPPPGAQFYPTVVNGQPVAQYKYEDFHQTLSHNPCG
jgi:hypothetical protein